MPELSILHNELRLRVPNKPGEFYDDALRWAITEICRKTSVWDVPTNVTTSPDENVYDMEMPNSTVIHSVLYGIQQSNTNRVIYPDTQGLYSNSNQKGDWLESLIDYSKNSVKIYPTPKAGGSNLIIHCSVKPVKNTTVVDNLVFFEEYADVVVYGALFRCFEQDRLYDDSKYNKNEFLKGTSSIKVDVLKHKSNIPLKISAAW